MLPAPSLAHSGLRIGLLSVWLRLNQLATPMNAVMAAAVIYLVMSAGFTASFFMPRSVDFSFAKQNCFTSPTLLPNMISKDQGDSFAAVPSASISIAGYPIYSHTTCVAPIDAPEAKVSDKISFSPLGISLLKKNISVSTGALPQPDYKQTLGKLIAPLDELAFPLNTPDSVFSYQLKANGQVAGCRKTNDAVLCSTGNLSLEHSTTYTFVLQRVYDGEVRGDVFAQDATTVGAVLISGSSIAKDEVVFGVPEQITLTLNKPAEFFFGLELNLVSGDTRTKLATTVKLDGQTLTIKLNEPLARAAAFELQIQNIMAEDGGHLPDPFVLTFTTSGGPRVKSANIGSYKVSTSSNIVLSFDSPVSASQNLAGFIKVEVNGSAVAASLSRNGSVVTINPSADLPKCTRFTVRVLDGLQNEFGISGGSAWTYNSRTICQSVFSIGTSVQGRGITAYKFGNGGSYVLLVGGTHGNEKSSTYTLNSFVDYLESHYDQIPAHRTVVVVPNLNPDGFAKTQRTNANNVDLNRNFPANDWKQGVSMPDGSFNANGGGGAPLSEPESSALASYTLSISPRLVLTYHAAVGVAIPNFSGDSDALTKVYDQKSNLGYSSGGGLFNYDTTGAYEDWLRDKHSIPTILLELWTKTNNEFSKNQNAMWHMVTLP